MFTPTTFLLSIRKYTIEIVGSISPIIGSNRSNCSNLDAATVAVPRGITIAPLSLASKLGKIIKRRVMVSKAIVNMPIFRNIAHGLM